MLGSSDTDTEPPKAPEARQLPPVPKFPVIWSDAAAAQTFWRTEAEKILEEKRKSKVRTPGEKRKSRERILEEKKKPRVRITERKREAKPARRIKIMVLAKARRAMKRNQQIKKYLMDQSSSRIHGKVHQRSDTTASGLDS